jgi:predicted short-subunit dehydrogenase-like oxidoreductase (DUF2520 family)
LGTALAERLAGVGYRISEIISRGNRRSLSMARELARKVDARAVNMRNAELTADLVWFCVPDAEISNATSALLSQRWKGKIAVHSSGVLASDVLAPLRQKGAYTASAHPLMTFVAGSVPQLEEVSFALEGDQVALRVVRQIVTDLGAYAIPIRKQGKVAYHAFATVVCPLLVSLLAAAEKTAALAGMSAAETRRRMMPILRQTLANYEKLGPARSFSGPIVRGDVETVREHIRTLAEAPAARRAYFGLAQAALEYLPSRNTEELRKLLRETSPEKIRHNAKRTDQESMRSARRTRKSL